MFAAYGNNKHLASALRQAKMAGDTEFLEAHKLTVVKVPEQWKLYFQAYIRLEADRPDSLSHIPWSAMAHYCKFYRLNNDQAETLIEILERVDNAVIEKRVKDHKNGNAGKSGTTPKRYGR